MYSKTDCRSLFEHHHHTLKKIFRIFINKYLKSSYNCYIHRKKLDMKNFLDFYDFKKNFKVCQFLCFLGIPQNAIFNKVKLFGLNKPTKTKSNIYTTATEVLRT